MTKKSEEVAAIEAYRARSQERRARQRAKNEAVDAPGSDEPDISKDSGVVRVKKALNAKSVSSLGGPTQAFGASNFSIPEFRRYAKRSAR